MKIWSWPTHVEMTRPTDEEIDEMSDAEQKAWIVAHGALADVAATIERGNAFLAANQRRQYMVARRRLSTLGPRAVRLMLQAQRMKRDRLAAESTENT